MTYPRPLTMLFLAVIGGLPSAAVGDEALTGFTPARAAEQRKLEARFDSHLKAGNLGPWMKRMSARPHHAGSEAGKQNAEFIAEMFRSWGYQVEIEVFYVLFPTPKLRKLELLEPARFEASLAEPALAEDSTSKVAAEEGLPPYNAYSADGDVTGELVYVNYGVPKDYEQLEQRGIDVKGRIVIARYGGSWRGIKPKVAAEKGAVGCIIYSDPRDDGYFQGDPYPAGPYKSDRGVQRGSVVDLPVRPGDPLTPGAGATKDAARLKPQESETLMKIPVLPISHADALPLLKALAGPVAPPDWRGALPITYKIGPGPAKVRLQLQFNWDLVPAYNVIARLAGSEFPDQWIIRGNHHDAWVMGADDPISGLVALMEEARAIAELAKTGWRPPRTLIYCAWDAEEPGLLGSTEWVEGHAEQLREKAVAYINTDSNGRGFLYVGGSHSLEKLVNEVARDVPDPQTDVSVAERLRARLLVNGDDKQRKEAARADLPIEALGSGSDYTPFLQHLGVAALNLGYGGENLGGEYHTLYDTFDHYTRFGDVEFQYGVASARTCGRFVLRLAHADVLPLEFTGTAETIGGYVDEVVALADTMRQETEETNRLIRQRRYQLAADPKLTYVPPKLQDPVPHLNFAPLLNAKERLIRSAAGYREGRDRLLSGKGSLPREELIELNRIVYQAERALTRPEGLPRRPWFRHQVYAPGLYTGYGVKTLPGVREAIEQRQWQQAEEQIQIAARTIEQFAQEIDRATERVDQAARGM